MRIPHQLLKPETLHAVIEAFVTREGTDYGAIERTIESKTADVMHQLENGQVYVTYDEASDSCSIIAKNAPPPQGAPGPSYEVFGQSHPRDEDAQTLPFDD